MFLVVLHFGRRYFVFGHPCSAQTDQPHQVVWSRIGDILVIVIDHRLIGELPRSCCKQECGDVGISTPRILRCMRCHSTALFVWFDVRTSRFCYFRMFFSFSNFFNSLQPSVVGHVFDHTALVSDLLTISEGSGWCVGGQSHLRSCWRLPLHVDDVRVPCDLAHINAELHRHVFHHAIAWSVWANTVVGLLACFVFSLGVDRSKIAVEICDMVVF